MSRIDDEVLDKAKPYQERAEGRTMFGGSQATLKAFLLVSLMLIAPLSGCFGETEETETVDLEVALTIDGTAPSEAVFRAGEWHDVLLMGENLRISAPAHDVLLFVDGVIDIDSSVPVEGDRVSVQLLTTPYTEHVELVVYAVDGTRAVFNQSITNGTPIITGEAWYEKMDYITCDTPSDDCGSYNFRWMGSPNAQFERAASYFQGHFEGLGYDTHLMRVVDTLNPTQPESLNVIAWKEGRSDDCVQGMGAHMDIAPPAGPPGGGTWEGAYDNTAGTVAIMMYAQVLVDLEVECDTFLALWSSEEEGLRGSNAFANNDCEACLPQDKELRFYINMDMMGISWPAVKENGDPFPYHAWSGPDVDPEVQDVAITSVLDHVHRNILKAPMDLRIDGSYGAGCDQHWDDHYNLVMDVHEDTFGRSDHVTFRNLGAQTIFHLGAYDEDYSAYHSPQDTLENMVAVVGGQENLEESIEFVLWAAFLEFVLADQDPEIRNVNA
ncbi:MAG: M28 family peptidase [Candidatus Thermoplasmatota archaeon]|nr:M28 family peptidase [Candidatus Thermoplasmatota archaeon]